MTARILVLQTQNAIIDFRLGCRPAAVLVRDFPGPAEALAYEKGIDAVADEYDRIEDLQVAGGRVTYTRRSDDPEAEAHSAAAAAEFPSAAEAEAFCQGLRDAEGFAAPLLIDDTDDRFEQLQAWAEAG